VQFESRGIEARRMGASFVTSRSVQSDTYSDLKSVLSDSHSNIEVKFNLVRVYFFHCRFPVQFVLRGVGARRICIGPDALRVVLGAAPPLRYAEPETEPGRDQRFKLRLVFGDHRRRLESRRRWRERAGTPHSSSSA